jgi:hypothetical protein
MCVLNTAMYGPSPRSFIRADSMSRSGQRAYGLQVPVILGVVLTSADITTLDFFASAISNNCLTTGWKLSYARTKYDKVDLVAMS